MVLIMQLLYLHGFNSSPQSYKAQATARWLADKHPDITFCCPLLSPFPDQAISAIEKLAQQCDGEDVLVMGSSMGGFYATWAAQKWGWKAVLINPAVNPWLGREYLLGVQKNFHSGEEYLFEQGHLNSFVQWDVPRISFPEKFWVLLQTGDEVLDYRLAQKKYHDCSVTIEEGGDHSFQGFERFLPDIITFWKN
jgi:predicted esterase YcpF (UPF0227 family)